AAECGDDTCRHGSLEATRVAEGDDELADPEVGRVSELGGGELGRGGSQDGEVREWVGADDLGGALGAVDERRAHAAGPLDDVRRGDEEAVGGDDDAAPAATVGAQVCDRR